MANRSKGIQGLLDFFNLGKKADEVAETRDVQKKIEETTKFDETTKPGEFKKGDTTVDAETGDVVTQEYSYRPESFTEMQMREGRGAFSEEALRQSYIDGKAADYMSFDEYVMQQRKISLEQLEAERAAGAKSVNESKERAKEIIATESPPDEFFGDPDVFASSSSPTSKNFIKRVVEASNKSEEEVRQAIVDMANEGYEAGNPKRMTIDDDARIEAYLENRLMYNTNDMEEFVDEFFETLSNVEVDSIPLPNISPQQRVLAEVEDELMKESSKVSGQLATIRTQTKEIKSQLDQMGLDTSDIDFDILENSSDMALVEKESAKLKEVLDSMLGGSMEDLTKSGNLGKAMESISEQAKADMLRGQELLEQVKTPGEGQEIMEKMEQVQKAYQEAMQTGVYKSPFDTKRTLNAEGGTIQLAGSAGDTPNSMDRDEISFEYFGKPYKKLNIDELKDLDELMDRLSDSFRGAKGGRVGLKDGGGPKIGRRGFLQGLGALGASLMLPFGRGAKEVAPVVTKAIKPAAGMPDWFPLLVNRIRTKGKVKREPGYAEFTSGGDTEKVYQLDDYIVYEDMATGKITVTGRGNDYQQVSMEYTPGQNFVMTDKSGKKGVMTEEPTFEAGEFSKGEYQDFENFGGYDDLKGDVSNWEKFATGGKKIEQKSVDSAINDFIKNQTDPNVIDDMAKGGRVGMAQGGIASKFKERVNYGN